MIFEKIRPILVIGHQRNINIAPSGVKLAKDMLFEYYTYILRELVYDYNVIDIYNDRNKNRYNIV